MPDGGPGLGFGASPSRRRLSPTVAKARKQLRDALAPVAPGELLLVACSGGPDSLALASVAAFFARRGDWRVGAVVVDHGLQAGSAEVAQRTAEVLTGLGLTPVEVRTVQVVPGAGPEAAARQARYQALEAAAQQHGAAAVLLGHTLDDQAEQVLLGLARGSGTRSLAGMPGARRGAAGALYLRPFLALRRSDTEQICRLENLDPWHDPTNADPEFARSRVRYRVLPVLEQELGPGIAESLHRSASILTQDADYLDQLARQAYSELVYSGRANPERGISAGVISGRVISERAISGRAEVSADSGSGDGIPGAVADGGELFLSESGLAELHPSIRHRVLALAVVALGGAAPSFERLRAVETLLRRRGSAGPVQLSGNISVYRQSRAERLRESRQQDRSEASRDSKHPGGYGKLVMRSNPSNH